MEQWRLWLTAGGAREPAPHKYLHRRLMELALLIDNALDLGDLGLLLAANEPVVDPAGVLHRRAAGIYADTVMLVEKAEDGRERRRRLGRIRQLREILERRQVQVAGA